MFLHAPHSRLLRQQLQGPAPALLPACARAPRPATQPYTPSATAAPAPSSENVTTQPVSRTSKGAEPKPAAAAAVAPPQQRQRRGSKGQAASEDDASPAAPGSQPKPRIAIGEVVEGDRPSRWRCFVRVPSLPELAQVDNLPDVKVGEQVAGVLQQRKGGWRLSAGPLLALEGTRLGVDSTPESRARVVQLAQQFLEEQQDSTEGVDVVEQWAMWRTKTLMQQLLDDVELKAIPATPRWRMPRWFSLTRGQVLKGTVTSLSRTGDLAMISLQPSVVGLLHMSQFSHERISAEEFQEALSVGSEVEVGVYKVEAPTVRGGIPRVYLSTSMYAPRQVKQPSAAQLLKVQEREQHLAEPDKRRQQGEDARRQAAEEAGLTMEEVAALRSSKEAQAQLEALEQQLASLPAPDKAQGIRFHSGALLRCTVTKHMPYGAFLELDSSAHPQVNAHPLGPSGKESKPPTLLLHISQVSGRRIQPEQLAELFPIGTKLVVKAVERKDTRFTASVKQWERGSGEWMEDKEACMARAEQAFQEQADTPAALTWGESGAPTLQLSATNSGSLQGLMLELDRLPLSLMLQAKSPELLRRYAQLVGKVEEAVTRVVGTLPWHAAADQILASQQQQQPAAAQQQGTLEQRYAELTKRHQFMAAQQLGLNLKARAALMVARWEVSGPDGAPAAEDMLSVEQQQRNRLLTEQEGLTMRAVVSSPPRPDHVVDLVQSLRAAVTALNSVQHPLGSRPTQALLSQWMQSAGPALLAWTEKDSSVEALLLLGSGVLPVLQDSGYLGRLRAERPEAWQEALDTALTKLTRRLVKAVSREQSALLEVTGLLQLAFALGCPPNASCWEVMIRALRERAPQLWDSDVRANQGEARRFKYWASRLAGRVLDVPPATDSATTSASAAPATQWP